MNWPFAAVCRESAEILLQVENCVQHRMKFPALTHSSINEYSCLATDEFSN